MDQEGKEKKNMSVWQRLLNLCVGIILGVVICRSAACVKEQNPWEKDLVAPETLPGSAPGPAVADPAALSWDEAVEAAKQADKTKQIDEAEKLWKAAVEKADAEEPKGWHLTTSLNELAYFYFFKGKYDDAKGTFQRLIDVRAQLMGPEHPDVASDLRNQASVFNFIKQYAEAEPILRRAVEIREKSQPDKPELAESLEDLANCLKNQKKDDEAAQLLARAATIKQQAAQNKNAAPAPPKPAGAK